MLTWDVLASPVHALPLDIFRVLAGVLTLAYFARTYVEAPTFSAPDGLIDHQLLRRQLPFTRLSVVPAGASLGLIRLVCASGCVASALLVLGIETQIAALWAYIVAVSMYRWNMILMYVDDAVMHLVLFWLVVLPVGHTLTLPGLLAGGAGVWDTWLATSVPGLAVRACLVGLALLYLVAGLWKWTSPMWRSGWALYAVLKMAVSYAPAFWRPSQGRLLKLANHAALVLEPLLPLLVFLPSGSALKGLLAVGAIGFHLSIIATMRFPFANLAMLAAGAILFGEELMGALGAPGVPSGAIAPSPTDWLAVATVACLASLFLLNALWFREGAPTATWPAGSVRRKRLNPFYVPLWIIGLAQSYRLFDWIDERNYNVEYEIRERRPGAPQRLVESTAMFPVSMRHILTQSYLHGNLWVRLNPAALPELRARILDGYARRYAEAHPEDATIEVDARVRRVTLDNLDLRRETRTQLMRFTIRDGSTSMSMACLTPPAYH
jgi:hypothetical protein